MSEHSSPLHRLAVQLTRRGIWRLALGVVLSWSAGSARAQPAAAGDLFRKRCASCHGADGSGRPVRRSMPEIPNFTAASWQARHSDAQLLAGILDGKEEMPAWRGDISEKQARDLVAYVRHFAPMAGRPGDQRQPAATDLEQRLRPLQKQVEELRQQFRKLSTDAPEQQESTLPGAPALFQQHCARCHGADGRGAPARARLPGIPDFTDPTWQDRHSKAQLRASILNGRDTGMPAWRGQLGEPQAQRLAAYVQALAASKGESQDRPPAPAKPQVRSASASR